MTKNAVAVTACQEAIRKFGGARKVAEQFGVTAQAVYKWDVVPAHKVLDIERVTGVSRHDLRPDIFGERA